LKKKKKKVLLVGGAGFIGHNLALKYLSKGHEVVIADSLQVNNFLYLLDSSSEIAEPTLYEKIIQERIQILRSKSVKFLIADFRDYHATSRIISAVEPDIVVMLAAVSHASRSNKDPFSTFDHSLRTLENVLDSIRNKAGTRFVFMSSSTVYGNFKEPIVDEESHCDPIGIYASLKLAGELIIKAYSQVSDIEYTIIRPSALYGERCISRRVGQIYIENAIAKRPLIVSATKDEKLDFTYIEDLTEGIYLASTKNTGINQIFNITRGDSQPINRLVEILEKRFPGIVSENIPRDKLVPKRGTLSNQKAKTLLGFASKYPIDIGYNLYIDWYLNFIDKHKIKLSNYSQSNE
jgi:nucleoside-diphosphate-sugar epimerase